MRFISLALLLLTLAPGTAYCQSLGMQSDWLELVKGRRDTKSGAQIMDVRNDPDTGHQMAVIRLPKGAMEAVSGMEEVRVVGRAPEQAEMPDLLPELQTEWVDDYDNDHYGLIVKLNSSQKIPFRLFFSTQGQGGSLDGGVQP